MGRPVVLSNGQLFVGLDESGLVHDFYYPYVGLDNLTNARNSHHRIGVWVDGAFSWVHQSTWEIRVDFEDEALISKVTMHSPELQITLKTRDFVDPDYNAFIRRITVVNEADHERDIRLFMHQVFQISRAGRADTALYVPDDSYILDYKGRCCLLVAGRVAGEDFDQFAVGNYGIEGKAGTFMDAEDGELSGNAVEHGGVDSVLRFRNVTPANQSYDVDYWIVASESQSDAQVMHTHIKYYSLEDRLLATRNYWRDWIAPSLDRIAKLPKEQQEAVKKAILIIKAHCDDRGSILASGDSSIFNYGRDYYCYCWPRDAANAIWPLIRLGLYGEAENFFEFARATMHRDGYLMHKYQPDCAIGSTWHPLTHDKHKELAIQEDETAIVVFMLGEYYRASKDVDFIRDLYETFVRPAANFMTGFVDEATGLPHASYDLWEQKFLTTTYTVCAVIAALETASELANLVEREADAAHWKQAAEDMRGRLDTLYLPAGYFCKGYSLHDGQIIYDETVDISSLYGPYMFAQLPLDDPRMQGTLARVQQDLYNTSPIGGVIRFSNDGYFLAKNQYSGNPWAVCSLWYAQYLFALGDKDKAQDLLDLTLKLSLPSGALSEQFDPETGEPLSVVPLVWSHAELVNTTLDLANIK